MTRVIIPLFLVVLVFTSIPGDFCMGAVNLYDIIEPVFSPDGRVLWPGSINDLGQICAQNRHAAIVGSKTYIWQDYELQIVPFTGSYKYANDINNNGWIIGGYGQEIISPPQLWNGSEIITLDTLGGGFAEGYDLNDKNQVVGMSRTTVINENSSRL